MKNQIAPSPSKTTTVTWPEGQPDVLRRSILKWHKSHGRHHLPWVSKETPNDYSVAVSELMMQQTTVAVGVKRFPLWLEQFPDWETLAAASDQDVMKAWEGLGYYARARSLHKMAKQVVNEFSGHVPSDREDRLGLPGVGPTTASALGAFVFGYREPIWDANVNRIWRRWWADQWPKDPSSQWHWDMAQQAMPSKKNSIRSWTQAVMDLGATVCTPKKPLCDQCPLKTSCRAHALSQEDIWGKSPPKPAVQILWKHWVWDARNNKVAVLKPKDKGLWPGLYQFPETTASSLQPIVSGNHKLTHRKVMWSIEKRQTKTQDDIQWVSLSEFDALPLPKPLRAWWDNTPADERLALFTNGD